MPKTEVTTRLLAGPDAYNFEHFRTQHLLDDLRTTMERRGIRPGALAPAAYGNGVLVLAMPIMESGRQGDYTEFRLEVIEATRGQRVGHTGSDLRPTTTAEHRRHIEEQTAPELEKP